MRKLRISFSLVIMLFLVGIFSSAAFAANGDGTNNPAAGVDTTGSLSDTIVDPSTGGTDDTNDNQITNVNETGKNVTTNNGSSVNDVIKSHDMVKNDGTTGNQRTHGEYQNNTNSCASCHQTHTGAAKNLLMKDGVYTTCTACHDGTLGFYNVFQASTAGTFGGDATHDASLHMANDSLQVSAAPGGNRIGTEAESWGKEFNCASCHSPHGSYSDRLLNYNVNNMGSEPSWEGGNAAWSKVYNFADVATILANIQTKYDADSSYNPKDEYGKYILVRGLWSDFGLTAPTGTVSTKVIVSYTFKVDHGTWSSAKAIAPVLYGYEYYNPNKWYVTKLFGLTDAEIAADTNNNRVPDKIDSLPKPYTATEAGWVYDANDTAMKFDYQKGYVYAADDATLDAITYGQVARAYVVDLDLYQYPGADLATNKADANFAAGGMLDYVADANLGVNNYGGIKIAFSNDQGLYKNGAGGKGVAMSQYCAACHTDYLANSGTNTGTFSTAYRHTTESDSYTCVRCHFAHGTDRDTMKDAQGRTFKDVVADLKTADPTLADADAQTKATAWLEDKDTSSALKKFTNMSGCWSCHQSSHAEQLINNPDTTAAAKALNGGWANETPALTGFTAIPNK